jgi:hypothetical protein
MMSMRRRPHVEHSVHDLRRSWAMRATRSPRSARPPRPPGSRREESGGRYRRASARGATCRRRPFSEDGVDQTDRSRVRSPRRPPFVRRAGPAPPGGSGRTRHAWVARVDRGPALMAKPAARPGRALAALDELDDRVRAPPRRAVGATPEARKIARWRSCARTDPRQAGPGAAIKAPVAIVRIRSERRPAPSRCSRDRSAAAARNAARSRS